MVKSCCICFGESFIVDRMLIFVCLLVMIIDIEEIRVKLVMRMMSVIVMNIRSFFRCRMKSSLWFWFCYCWMIFCLLMMECIFWMIFVFEKVLVLMMLSILLWLLKSCMVMLSGIVICCWCVLFCLLLYELSIVWYDVFGCGLRGFSCWCGEMSLIEDFGERFSWCIMWCGSMMFLSWFIVMLGLGI